MANLTLAPMRLSYQEGNYSGAVNFSTPEAATQTYFDGAPVVASGGNITECGANPARIDGVGVGNAHNYAAATADGLHNAMFTLPDTDIVYEVSIDKASAQAGALAVLAASDVETTIGITKDTIGGSPAGTALYWYADVDKKGANQRCLIIGFPAFSPPGTVNGRVYVKFLAANVLQ
jgi:hypothetical protein